MGSSRRYAGLMACAGALVTGSIIVAVAPAGAQTASPNTAGAPVISTYAGTGQPGFSGDGGQAKSAKLQLPTGAAEDAAGNVYFDDTANNRVRRISTGGLITTVAGNGQAGFGGDGGAATNARLTAPTGVALDPSGSLYIADTGNNRVRKVTTGGTISTFAGTGGFCSLSGNNGPATKAGMCFPTGVAADSGNVYIADLGNSEIRKVNPAGVITAFAGNGHAGSSGDNGPATSAQLNAPAGVSIDSLHNVLIADSGNNKIRKVSASGTITTIAGTGPSGFSGDGNKATLAKLDDPTGLGIDPLGNIYITDSGNCRIRVIIPKGDILTYAGTGSCGYSGDGGPATAARINIPLGSIAVDASNIYFGDTANQRVRRVQGGPPPNIPETPYVIILPLSAAALLAGAYLITRRRRVAPNSIA